MEYYRNPDHIFVETNTSNLENQRPRGTNMKISAISSSKFSSESGNNKGDKHLKKIKNYINKKEINVIMEQNKILMLFISL